jgi:PmbA protein
MAMLAPDILDLALDAARAVGADAADLMLVERASLEVSWRLGELEALERKEAHELGIRLLIGRRQATAATGRLDRESLRALIADLAEGARHLPEDPFVGLADPADLVTAPPELDLADAAEPTAEALIEAAAACEDAARSIAGISNSEGAAAGWSRRTVTLALSNGFRGAYTRTTHRIGVTVLAGTGTAMERDHEWRAATHRADLPGPAEIGRSAAERTLRRLGPRKIASAAVPVVYEPRVAASLLRHLAAAINGEAVAKGTSFLRDSLGEAVCGRGVVVVDDPLRPRGLASRPFDAEGFLGRRRRLVDAGMLTTWLLDLATARRLGFSGSTGHAARAPESPPAPAATNLVLEPGTASPEELMSDIRSGLYVTDLMGMGVSMVTGDYSRGAAGFRIERGEIAYPVSEVTIAGNLKHMLTSLVPASDLAIRGSCDAPTVRVDGMTVAGR